MSSKIQTLRKGFYFFKQYFFHSNERKSALLMLFASILCVAALVALVVFIPWALGGFWGALVASNLPVFGLCLAKFGGLVAGVILTNILKDYLTGTLAIRWRTWLTKRFLGDFLQDSDQTHNNYLDLARLPDLASHPQQRIQEDIRVATEGIVNCSLDFLLSMGRLGAFIGSLWVIGGALTFIIAGTTMTLPGYLVWAALAFAIMVTVIKRTIGHKLSSIMNAQKQGEAAFRTESELLVEQAESISLENGESYYKASLENRLETISNNTHQKLKNQTSLNAFQTFTNMASIVLPYIAAAPLYFGGLMNMDTLMQVGVYFGEVLNGLGWFATSFELLSELDISIARLDELEQAINRPNTVQTPREIVLRNNQENSITIDNLALARPTSHTENSSTVYILKALHLNFRRGESTLIQGVSGLGKSTLFKALSGNWRYGSGIINLPDKRKLMFLAQKTTLPQTSLRSVLAYPNTSSHHQDNAYHDVLRKTGLEQFIPQLNVEDRWASRLSGGQQQRIAFARALLERPDWLFLDETTASLDSKSEAAMYDLLKKELPNTTVVSIAHRPSVREFHDRVVGFEGTDTQGNLVLC